MMKSKVEFPDTGILMYYDTIASFYQQLKYLVGVSKEDKKTVKKIMKKIEKYQDEVFHS